MGLAGAALAGRLSFGTVRFGGTAAQAAIWAVGAGIIGLALSFGATSALSSFLFGVSAFDPIVFSGVTLALIGAVILATLVPARRATRVDPLVALRAD